MFIGKDKERKKKVKTRAVRLCLSQPFLSSAMYSVAWDVSQAGKIEVDFFCATAAEPGDAEGNGEESRTGNQWQNDWNSEEAWRSCAATAQPGGTRKAEIPQRGRKDCKEIMVRWETSWNLLLLPGFFFHNVVAFTTVFSETAPAYAVLVVFCCTHIGCKTVCVLYRSLVLTGILLSTAHWVSPTSTKNLNFFRSPLQWDRWLQGPWPPPSESLPLSKLLAL